MSESLPPGLHDRLDASFRRDPHAAHLGIEIISWAQGSATVGCTITEGHTNFLGGGHGGVMFSLADVAMSIASNTVGRITVAVQVDISYLRRVVPGDRLTATATVTNTSRRLTHIDIEVMAGERKVSAATAIGYRTDDWLFGAEAWPDSWRSTH
ncbi:MAG: hotdog fold thioesterase [Actinomycetia bacterium]|nr:hotdog fold thioesterase [Actinomycetes bacterium]MCP4224947.1 hotdog fold thioesterase [Actinomycetes bacterium]MCP5031634.1 hotdog fold thioesterase [Actinomycetes bacterium]